MIRGLSFPTEAIITELRESIKQLSAENKEKHVALQDASSELKELKELVESVSTKNYVFAILYYSNYTAFELDSSFNSCLIRQSFTIIFSTTRFILFKSCSIRQSPLFSSPPFTSTTRFIPFPLHRAPIPLFLGLFPPPPEPCYYPCLILYCILYRQEKRNFKEYMLQMASETEVYRKHIERLQMVSHLTDLL